MTIGAAFVGCGHEHIWKAATCSEPQTCTTCGETMGEALGHSWIEATCETPKTCEVCGNTEGELSGHQWIEATCETPKTCSVCGLTEGDTIEHDFTEATFDSPKTCKVCGITEGGVYTLVNADEVNEIYEEYGDDAIILPNGFLMEDYDGYANCGFGIFDFNQKGIGYYAHSTLGYGITCGFTSSIKDYVYIAFTDWSGNEKDSIYMIIGVHDLEGNYLDKIMIPVNSFKVGDIIACDIEGGQYLIFKYESKDSEIAAFDKTTNKFVDISEVPFDMDQFKDYSRFSYSEVADCYFVCTKKDNKWGYADKNGNLIKTYYGASDFNTQGYALVLNDDGNVSIIDKDLNLVKENVMTGEGVFVTGDILRVKRDGKKYFYRIGLSDSIDSNIMDSEESQEDTNGDDSGQYAQSEEDNFNDDTAYIDVKSIKEDDVLSLGQTIKLSFGESVSVIYYRDKNKGTYSAVCSGDTWGMYETYELGTELRAMNGGKESEVTSCEKWRVIDVQVESTGSYPGYTIYVLGIE